MRMLRVMLEKQCSGRLISSGNQRDVPQTGMSPRLAGGANNGSAFTNVFDLGLLLPIEVTSTLQGQQVEKSSEPEEEA